MPAVPLVSGSGVPVEVLALAADHAPEVLGAAHSYTGMLEIETARALYAVGDAVAAMDVLDALADRAPEPGGELAWRNILETAGKVRSEWVEVRAEDGPAR